MSMNRKRETLSILTGHHKPDYIVDKYSPTHNNIYCIMSYDTLYVEMRYLYNKNNIHVT
jgi:hypothetical protein